MGSADRNTDTAPSLDLRLGVDVGGTNTDAVVVDRDDRLIAKAKIPTTSDVTSGIAMAVGSVLGRAKVEPARITHAMLGTTHATNAILERRRLRRVAVIRLGAPATHAVRPLFGWPDDLRAAVSVGETIVGGGIEFDGRELAPFDGEAVVAVPRHGWHSARKPSRSRASSLPSRPSTSSRRKRSCARSSARFRCR